MNTDLEFFFNQEIETFYRQLIELLLHDIDSLDDIEKQIRLEESRIAIEDLRKEELEDFLAIAEFDVRQQSIEKIDPYAAAIYQIVLENSLDVILSVREQPLQHYRTKLDGENQKQIFQEVCQDLNPICKSSDILPSAQKLYNWLILPIENILQTQEIKTLVFILDRFLHHLPMAVLHDGNQYLIEKYNIALSPGLNLLPPKTLKETELSLLIGGVTQARQGFAALPEVRPEIAQISQIIPSTILLDAEFTPQSLQKQLNNSPFSILHLTSYTQFSSNAENTFVLTGSDRLDLSHWSNLRTRTYTPETLKLLVLSAGQIVEEDSRAILGLTGIAICSGAESIVSTVWLIREPSTVNLLQEFYRLLTQANISPAEALRQAQISLLTNPQYQHPYYWSSFVLVGNWL
ncbi:MAG: CHAT domain-containing protein [Xenococcus sp. (in: cyanobacteria)]